MRHGALGLYSRTNTALAATHVLLLRDGLEVSGVHAASVTAQMVNDQPFRNGAEGQLVGSPMRPEHAIWCPESSVAVRRNARLPRPALIRRVYL